MRSVVKREVVNGIQVLHAAAGELDLAACHKSRLAAPTCEKKLNCAARLLSVGEPFRLCVVEALTPCYRTHQSLQVIVEDEEIFLGLFFRLRDTHLVVEIV